MNYRFFLFSKLFDVYHTTDTPYDILYDEVSAMYKDWLVWDSLNGKNIGEYESMCNYLSQTIPTI